MGDAWTASADNAMSETEIATFLAEPRVARLATTEPDGSVHLTPVWFQFGDGRFAMTLGQRRRHLRNLRRDPRATLLIDVDERPERLDGAVVRAVMCRGTVELCDDPARVDAVSRQIDRRYLSVSQEAQAPASPELYVLVTLVPDKLLTWDFGE